MSFKVVLKEVHIYILGAFWCVSAESFVIERLLMQFAVVVFVVVHACGACVVMSFRVSNWNQGAFCPKGGGREAPYVLWSCDMMNKSRKNILLLCAFLFSFLGVR